jgi:hypothetical protein
MLSRTKWPFGSAISTSPRRTAVIARRSARFTDRIARWRPHWSIGAWSLQEGEPAAS